MKTTTTRAILLTPTLPPTELLSDFLSPIATDHWTFEKILYCERKTKTNKKEKYKENRVYTWIQRKEMMLLKYFYKKRNIQKEKCIRNLKYYSRAERLIQIRKIKLKKSSLKSIKIATL